MNDLGYLVALFLLPLIVAFVLFYFLPANKNAAGVKGPLKGLKIKASGAIAGYVIVLLIAIPFVHSMLESKQKENEALRRDNDQLKVERETWKVYGRIALADATADPQKTSLMVVPPKQYIYPNGKFEIQMRIPTFQAGPRDIPEIVISHAGYKAINFPVDSKATYTSGYAVTDYKLRFDTAAHEIYIEQPIHLELDRPEEKKGYDLTKMPAQPLNEVKP